MFSTESSLTKNIFLHCIDGNMLVAIQSILVSSMDSPKIILSLNFGSTHKAKKLFLFLANLWLVIVSTSLLLGWNTLILLNYVLNWKRQRKLVKRSLFKTSSPLHALLDALTATNRNSDTVIERLRDKYAKLSVWIKKCYSIFKIHTQLLL